MLSLFNKAKKTFFKYERLIMSVSLFTGFIIDNLTFQRIDRFFDNLVLFFYLTLSGLSIIFMNLYRSNKLQNKFMKWLGLLSPIGLQYAFGGLFSAFFIVYFRSATFGTSWPFLLLLFFLLIGNELFYKEFRRLQIQIGILFFSIFSFFIFFIPVIVEKMGTNIFIISGLLSLVLIFLFLWFFSKIDTENFLLNKKKIIIVVLTIFFVINISYFTNIIPPIPLSLKEINVAYETNKTSEGYRVVIADLPWHKKIFPKEEFKIEKGKPVYVYASVFAPTDLEADITHQWQFKNKEGNWETKDEINFPIRGGRADGYRGYTILWKITETDWRVNIKTKTGQTIGRKSFSVEFVEESQEKEINKKIVVY